MLKTAILTLIAKYDALAVGVALTWLAVTLHVVVDPASEAVLIGLTTAILTVGYNGLTVLAKKYLPWLGRILDLGRHARKALAR
jgi:putative Mn2+ efflux pump MntP